MCHVFSEVGPISIKQLFVKGLGNSEARGMVQVPRGHIVIPLLRVLCPWTTRLRPCLPKSGGPLWTLHEPFVHGDTMSAITEGTQGAPHLSHRSFPHDHFTHVIQCVPQNKASCLLSMTELFVGMGAAPPGQRYHPGEHAHSLNCFSPHGLGTCCFAPPNPMHLLPPPLTAIHAADETTVHSRGHC